MRNANLTFHRLRIAAGAVLLLGAGILPSWTQEPAKKAPVADKKAPPERAALRPENLAAEAVRTSEPVFREVYRKLAVPHDIVYWSGGRTTRVAPFFQFVDDKSEVRGIVRLYPLNDRDTIDKMSITAKRADITRIEPYEYIALTEVRNLLDEQRGSGRALPRLQVLQAGERALTAVANYHKAAREDGTREGRDWDDLGRQLLEQLFLVQRKTIGLLADTGSWDEACDRAEALAKTHPQPAVQALIAQELAQSFPKALQDDKLAEVQQRVKRWRALFPSDVVAGKINDDLARKAAELFDKAKKEKDRSKAMSLLMSAEHLWPRLPGLHDYRLQLGDAYPILYVGVSSLPRSLSPGSACTDAERWAIDLLFESLVQPVHDRQWGIRYDPVLASERPRLIPLGREFVLARDAYWSDGTPVTAVDVRYTVQLLSKRGKAPLLSEARVAADPYHVSLTLHQGFFDPLALMSFKVLPASARLDNLDDPTFASKPIGSGPFRHQESKPDHAIFVANHNYRRAGKLGQPYIREVRFVRSKDPVGDFGLGRLHLLLDPEAVSKVASVPGVKIHVLPNRRIYFLAVNHRRAPLQSKELRRALALAIDRNKILNDVFRAGFKGAAAPHKQLNGPFPPGCWACNPDLKKELFNLNGAKAKASKSKGQKLTLKFPSDDARVARACAALRSQIAEVGIELELKARTPHELRAEVEGSHDYDLAYYSFEYDCESFMLWPMFDPNATGPGGSNYLGYRPDAELHPWCLQALDHRQFSKVQEGSHAIHRILFNSVPLIPLWQLDTILAVHDRVQTAPTPENLDPLRIFNNVEKWRLK